MKSFDSEVNPNFFLLIVYDMKTGFCQRWEIFNGEEKGRYTRDELRVVLASNTCVSFNGLGYDDAIICAYLAGMTTEQIFEVSQYIINTDMSRWKFHDEFGFSQTKYGRHIDLMPVSPGMASLKIYGGRLNCKKLQDLPVDWAKPITKQERDIVVPYCGNDNMVTTKLYGSLREQIKLRAVLSNDYGINLLSSSDAQIAEGVIKKELERVGVRARGGEKTYEPSYRYTPPKYITFRDEVLQKALHTARTVDYKMSPKGKLMIPPEIGKAIEFEGNKYKMGIGGLHSQEKARSIEPEEGMTVEEFDVRSYYPEMIINNRYYPETLGEKFLDVYSAIVSRRVKAKETGDKVTDKCLKIVINSSFGKFGNKYSSMFSPSLLLHTTMTGQLSLLMLIEMFSEGGIEVVSANTDGVVCKLMDDTDRQIAHSIAEDWNEITGLFLEATPYTSLYSQSVNNYFAVKTDNTIKTKGCFAETGLMKNPQGPIVFKAVIAFLADGVPLMQTFEESEDITDFVHLRKSTSGAIYEGKEVGKCVRWYYSDQKRGGQITTGKGGKVANSDGARLINDLPDEFPLDVDYDKYLEDAQRILTSLGY